MAELALSQWAIVPSSADGWRLERVLAADRRDVVRGLRRVVVSGPRRDQMGETRHMREEDLFRDRETAERELALRILAEEDSA